MEKNSLNRISQDKKFSKTIEEIEQIQKTFSTKGSTKEYENYWPIGKIIDFPSISRESAEAIYSLVLSKKPKLILELGTCIGYSALWMAQALKINKNQGRLYSIDMSKNEIEIANNFFKKAGLNNICTINSEILPVLEKWPKEKKIDFLFIDADKKNYLNYLKILEPKLKKKATIVSDNIESHKKILKDFIEYLTNNKVKYRTQFLNIGKGLMISIKK